MLSEISQKEKDKCFVVLLMHAYSLQACLTLCNPTDYSLQGFFVCGILQARILEWVGMSSSRGSF